jgi:hypothetical protein
MTPVGFGERATKGCVAPSPDDEIIAATSSCVDWLITTGHIDVALHQPVATEPR